MSRISNEAFAGWIVGSTVVVTKVGFAVSLHSLVCGSRLALRKIVLGESMS